MPLLFLSTVQPRVQASTLCTVARPCVPLSPLRPPVCSIPSHRSQRQRPLCQATGKSEPKFDENDYITASVEAVRLQASNGPVICLKIDSRGSILPVYVGDAEARALLSGLQSSPMARPLTHDLMKTALAVTGYKAMFPTSFTNLQNLTQEVIQSYIDVANKMGVAAEDRLSAGVSGSSGSGPLSESHAEIVKTCKEECRMYRDPTVMEQLQLQMAVEAERYEEASQLRDKIDHILQSDRAMSLVVAIETALDDKRYEEAARLREELKALRTVRSPAAE